MIIDFHTHSHASDGTLSPSELLARARAAGVSQLALTDHDTVAGFEELRDNVDVPADIRLLSGVELSCTWSKTAIHVVGLGMDVENLTFRAGLEHLAAARAQRAEIIAAKLERAGMPGALEGARREAGTSELARPHFAAWMAAAGHVRDISQAFDRYLGAGKIGDVKALWPDMAKVVEWVVRAGGSAVLAHPLNYKFTRTKLRACVADFKAAGGVAIEVYSGRQDAGQVRRLCDLASDFEFAVSGGSDFHGHRHYGQRLGFNTSALPDQARLLRVA
ncbi:MAG: PHP domain-containing protein [Pseudomonadota bacterium]